MQSTVFITLHLGFYSSKGMKALPKNDLGLKSALLHHCKSGVTPLKSFVTANFQRAEFDC